MKPIPLNNGFEIPIKEMRDLQQKLLDLVNNDISNMRIKDYTNLMVELRALSKIGGQVKERVLSEIEKL